MAFDLASAKPVEGGFDLASAKPVQDVAAEFAKGNASSLIPGAQPQPKPQDSGPWYPGKDLVGDAEAGTAIATGTGASAIANIVAAVRETAARTMGADQTQGRLEGQEAGGKVADALTYQPRGEAGKEKLESVGKIVDATKIQGLNPAEPVRAFLPKTAGAEIGQQAEREVQAAKPLPSQMPGVGGAETDAARMRRERAASFPVPVKLTKGTATRDFEQMQFERETAKGEAGKPLRERFAENNESILRNFDAWVDQTGAEAPTLRATGQVVDEALVAKAKSAKAQINKAYAEARESGEMQAPVATSGVREYLNQNVSAEGTSPILAAARKELDRLEKVNGGSGSIPINDMERLRQFVSENMSDQGPDKVHGPKIKAAIDEGMEGAGGELFKKARRLRTAYAKEFEDRAIVAKLLDTKGKYADRAVALEDVFQHSILSSSLDDVKHLRRVLQTEGPKGEQAWRELQGQAVQHIRAAAAEGKPLDIKGNPIVSPAALDKAVRGLDVDGKLDFIFGKKGAQQLRDLNDLAKDLTPVPGTVNYSNTSSALMRGLKDWGKSIIGGKIGVAMKVGDVIKKVQEEKRTNMRVREALEETQ